MNLLEHYAILRALETKYNKDLARIVQGSLKWPYHRYTNGPLSRAEKKAHNKFSGSVGYE